VKLTRVSKENFLFRLGRREKFLLLEVLKLYPRVPSAYLTISKSGKLPDKDSSQKLLEEALAEQRAENRHRLQTLVSNPARWTQTGDACQISLSMAELDWLLQVLNDIRVGSWIILGSPDERFEAINPQTAPHLWAMEMAGSFQMYLLHALEQEPGK